ncbi:MAG: hypothetical protein ACUVRP_03050 [Chlorobiales bacterium]
MLAHFDKYGDKPTIVFAPHAEWNRAKVKITKILGYGSGFIKPLSEGSEVEMTFAFTLAPTTNDLFPNFLTRYPRLKTGNTFQADVQTQVSMGEAKPSLIVMNYEVK